MCRFETLNIIKQDGKATFDNSDAPMGRGAKEPMDVARLLERIAEGRSGRHSS